MKMMMREGVIKGGHTERFEVMFESVEDDCPVRHDDSDEEGGGARSVDHHLIDRGTAGVCSMEGGRGEDKEE